MSRFLTVTVLIFRLGIIIPAQRILRGLEMVNASGRQRITTIYYENLKPNTFISCKVFTLSTEKT